MVGKTHGAAAAAARVLPLDDPVSSIDVTDLKRSGPRDSAEPESKVVPVAPPAVEAGRSVDELVGCVNALFTLLEIYGLTPRNGRGALSARVRSSFDGTVKHWQAGSAACGADGWMKFVKYKTAAFFHATTPQEDSAPPPPFPDSFVDHPAQLCTGVASRFIKILLQGDQAFSFITSVSQLKKGCPRPSQAMVDSSVDKAVKALTTVHVEPNGRALFKDWIDLDDCAAAGVEMDLTVETMKRQLVRTVKELFYGLKYTDEHRNAVRLPSTSATFEDACASGGGVNSIAKLAAGFGLNTAYNAGKMGVGKTNVHIELVRSTMEDERREPEYGTIRAASRPSEVFPLMQARSERVGKPAVEVLADLRMVETKYNFLYKRATREAMRAVLTVKPVGLAESLKVRVITKGPAAVGFVLKPLQKFMWSALARHPAFTLIGQPVDAWTVQNRLGKNLPSGQAYLSGDYSAATDNLAPWVSETIAEAIGEEIGLTDDEVALFVKALTRHVFVDDEGVETPQMWGQLMGSVVSFPVLCVANAAMCRWSLECAFRRKYMLADTSLLINGDDCLFRTTHEGLRLWKEITSFGGLTPSLGKFFFSRLFAQVNSANFVRRSVGLDTVCPTGKPRVLHFDLVKYVNLGLMFGLKRSSDHAEDVADASVGLGVKCREMIKSGPIELSHKLLISFIAHHRKLLDRCRVPWFVPESLGGVGLPTVRGDDEMEVVEEGSPELGFRVMPRSGPTKLNRRVAARIRERPDLYPVARIPSMGTWEMHKIAMSRLPVAPVIGVPTAEEERAWQRLYSSLIVDTIFSCTTLTTLKSDKVTRGKKVLKLNASSWDKALRSGSLPPPLSHEALARATKETEFVKCTILSDLKPEPLGPVLAIGFADFDPNGDLWA